MKNQLKQLVSDNTALSDIFEVIRSLDYKEAGRLAYVVQAVWAEKIRENDKKMGV